MWKHKVYCAIEIIMLIIIMVVYMTIRNPSNMSEEELGVVGLIFFPLFYTIICLHAFLYSDSKNDICLKFKRLKIFMDLAPEKYRTECNYVVYTHEPNSIPIFIYFPTIIDWIKYLIYKKSIRGKNKEYDKTMKIFKSYMKIDLEDYNKEFEEMIKNINK